MLQPIQKDHELICPCGCGAVVGIINEPQQSDTTSKTPDSPEVFLLGTVLQNNLNRAFNTPQKHYEERLLKNLILLIKEVGLPDRFAIETFNELKRRKRGFRSETEPIKQLIKILSKDDNYLYVNKLKLIKSKYETILSK